MLKLIKWVDDELVSANEAAIHLRIDDEPEDIDHLQNILIPGARGMAEEITGCFLRKGEYSELIKSGQPIAKGNVHQVKEVSLNGSPVPFRVTASTGRTFVVIDGSDGDIEVVFEAGYTPEECPPQLKQWLLMVSGFLYRDRDLSKDSPKIRNLDFVLASLSIPSLF